MIAAAAKVLGKFAACLCLISFAFYTRYKINILVVLWRKSVPIFNYISVRLFATLVGFCHARSHIGRKNCGTVTATVLVRFSLNLVCGYLRGSLGLRLQISILRHQLLVKMTVEKTVKTGSDVNQKTKYRFWLISTRWTWIYAYLVHLTKTDRWNNGQTSAKFRKITFLEYSLFRIYSSWPNETFHA